MPWVLPLVSALVYVVGALLLKQAGQLGTGTWRMAWVCNLTAGVVYAPLALLGGATPPWPLFWQPAAVALLFVLGQVLGFRSLQIGDVSVATPVLGVKIILVALFTSLFLRERLTPAIWSAAALSSAAIALLNAQRPTTPHRVGATVVLASLAAAAYALFDVLVQRWSPAWGLGRFLPVMMGFVVLYSLPLRWLSRPPGVPLSRAAGMWLAGGALCLAVQSILFVSTIALSGQATVANVLYSSRGLWSVLAVWLVGHWFGNREQQLGARVLSWRLCGAGLLMAAILLVVGL